MHFWLLVIIAQALLFTSVTAQNISVPSGWRKPTSSLSFQEREDITQSVIDSMTPLFNASSGEIDVLPPGQSANLLNAIALYDFIAGKNTSKDIVVNNLETVFKLNPNYHIVNGFNSDTIQWALAAISAYRAYRVEYLLYMASSAWDQVYQYFVTPDNAASGSHPRKTISIAKECNYASTAGAVFWAVANNSDTTVNGGTVGAFATLSAHLYEVTSDQKYANAAELSAQFIRSQLYNNSIVRDSINISACTVSTFAVTRNSGLYIEALAVHSSTFNGSWTPFLQTLISDAINFPRWTGSDGIITEAPSDGTQNSLEATPKGVFIRGLYEAWSHISSDSDVAKLIEGYVLVQLNALLDLASLPSSNQFSPRWQGPPISQLLPLGQVAAMNVLNSAFAMGPNATSQLEDAPISNPKKPNIGLIIGLTIGGAVLVLGLMVLIVFLRRRRCSKLDGPNYYIRTPLDDTPEPYSFPPVSQVPNIVVTEPIMESSSQFQSRTTGPSKLQETVLRAWPSPEDLSVTGTSSYQPDSSVPEDARFLAQTSVNAESNPMPGDPSKRTPMATVAHHEQPGTADVRDNSGPASISMLIQQLNVALAGLPPPNGEEPPRYES